MSVDNTLYITDLLICTFERSYLSLEALDFVGVNSKRADTLIRKICCINSLQQKCEIASNILFCPSSNVDVIKRVLNESHLFY